MRMVFTQLLIAIGFSANAYTPFGYSEFFLRINEPGIFTIRVDDQIITNSSGRFRFFDLRPGVKEVFVQRNGRTILRSFISIYNNSRTVAEFRSNQGIIVLQQIPLMHNNQFAQDFWYGYWDYNPNTQWPDNPSQWNDPDRWNNPNQWNNPNRWNNMPVGMDANTFNQFKETVNRQSFDSNKANLIKNQARTANFTSAQVAELLGMLSFDSHKLDVAKFCYDFVIDRQNYFVTFNQFQFDGSVRELTNFIATRN